MSNNFCRNVRTFRRLNKRVCSSLVTISSLPRSIIGKRLAGCAVIFGVASALLVGEAHASIHPCTAQLVSGNGQTASVNATLPQPLIMVLNGPVAGEPISWGIVGPPGATGQSVSPSSLKTGADGRIQATVVLGSLPGTYQISFSSASGGTCFQSPAWPTFSETATPQQQQLAITTEGLPPATAGQPYLTELAATGGMPPYTWSIARVGNPSVSPLEASRLTLNPTTGTISGSRIYGGNNRFTVIVQDSAGTTVNRTFSINTACGFTKQDFPFSRLTSDFAQYKAST